MTQGYRIIPAHTHRFKPYRRDHFGRRSGMHLKRMCHKCKSIRLPKMHDNRNSSQSMRSRDIGVPPKRNTRRFTVTASAEDTRGWSSSETERPLAVWTDTSVQNRLQNGYRNQTFCSGHNQGCCCFKQSRPPSSAVRCLPNMASSP